MRDCISTGLDTVALIIGLGSALSWLLSAQTDIKILIDFFNLSAANLAVISSTLVALSNLIKK